MKLKRYKWFGYLFLSFVASFAVANDDSSEVVEAPQWTIPPSKLVNLDNPDRVPDRYIVVFKDDDELAKDVPPSMSASLDIAPGIMPTTEENIATIGRGLADRAQAKATSSANANQKSIRVPGIRHIYSKALRGISLEGLSQVDVAELARDPRIKYVEAVLMGRAAAVQSAAPWDLDRLDQNLGLDGLYHYLSTGAGVTIWVIDTGVQFSHNEFGGRAGTSDVYFVGCGMGQNCSNYYQICTNGGSCSYYYPYLQTNPAVADICGHGTAVASAAAGAVSGVAKGATVIGVSLGCTLQTDVIIAGIDYVLNHKKANTNIINLSIEVSIGDQFNPAFENAVAAAVNSGIVFVTSAGNDADNACNYDPGRLAYVITVGASARNDLVSSYSNYGPCITLFAPGDHVTVADNGFDYNMDNAFAPQGSNTGLNTISGTSFSAPIVAGIAALYLQTNPGASPATVKKAITSAAWPGKLKDTRQGVVGSPNLLASVCVTTGNSVCSSGSGAGSKSTLPIVLQIIESLLLNNN